MTKPAAAQATGGWPRAAGVAGAKRPALGVLGVESLIGRDFTLRKVG